MTKSLLFKLNINWFRICIIYWGPTSPCLDFVQQILHPRFTTFFHDSNHPEYEKAPVFTWVDQFLHAVLIFSRIGPVPARRGRRLHFSIIKVNYPASTRWFTWGSTGVNRYQLIYISSDNRCLISADKNWRHISLWKMWSKVWDWNKIY